MKKIKTIEDFEIDELDVFIRTLDSMDRELSKLLLDIEKVRKKMAIMLIVIGTVLTVGGLFILTALFWDYLKEPSYLVSYFAFIILIVILFYKVFKDLIKNILPKKEFTY